jgi:hypothetical protein
LDVDVSSVASKHRNAIVAIVQQWRMDWCVTPANYTGEAYMVFYASPNPFFVIKYVSKK